MSENAQVSHPYYRIFGILTVLTVAEILWVFVVPHSPLPKNAACFRLRADETGGVCIYRSLT